MNMLSHLVLQDYRYSDEELRELRRESVRIVSDTNGSIHLGENTDLWHD